MKKVEIISVKENEQAKFIKTKMLTYKREGEGERIWEIVQSHDTVHILVDNVETKEILVVSQVRIPVLNKDKSQNGVCLETCAGIVDKDLPVIEIAREEVEEELGYKVETNNISLIKEGKSGLGTTGNNCYYFKVDVTEKDKINDGGGLESEDIEVIRIPYEEVEETSFNNTHSDSTTMFLLTYWLYQNLKNKK